MLEIGRLAALLAALIKIVAKVLIGLIAGLPTFSEAMFARRSRHVRLPFLVKAYKNILIHLWGRAPSRAIGTSTM